VDQRHINNAMVYVARHCADRADVATAVHQVLESVDRHWRRGERLRVRRGCAEWIDERLQAIERSAILRADRGTRMPEATYLDQLRRLDRTKFKFPELLSEDDQEAGRHVKAEIEKLAARQGALEAEWAAPPYYREERRQAGGPRSEPPCRRETDALDTIQKLTWAATARRSR
jgi:hypothetical protein